MQDLRGSQSWEQARHTFAPESPSSSLRPGKLFGVIDEDNDGKVTLEPFLQSAWSALPRWRVDCLGSIRLYGLSEGVLDLEV